MVFLDELPWFDTSTSDFLRECEEFYEERRVAMSRYDAATRHMVLGGIPSYMGHLEPDKSLAQNIDIRVRTPQNLLERLVDSASGAGIQIRRCVHQLRRAWQALGERT